MHSKIPIGVVGLNFGRHIVEQITSGPGAAFFQLAAVCDQNRARSDEFATREDVPAYYSLEDLLQRADIPAIGLFTGPIHRSQLLRQILKTGKHILTTKPFELDPIEAKAVLTEARHLGLAIHLNSPAPLLSPDLAQIQAWVAEFQLGRPIGARAEAWHGGGFTEVADGSWFDDPELCPVAPLYRIGIYLINDLIRLWGPVDQVQVMHARLRTGRPTPDTAAAILRFQNGALGNLFATFCINDSEPGESRLTLNYERGTIYRDVGPRGLDEAQSGSRNRLELVCTSGQNKRVVRTVECSAISGAYQWEAFYRAVRGEQLAQTVEPQTVVMGLNVIQALKRAGLTQAAETVQESPADYS
jgi:predicted dehydrogenase